MQQTHAINDFKSVVSWCFRGSGYDDLIVVGMVVILIWRSCNCPDVKEAAMSSWPWEALHHSTFVSSRCRAFGVVPEFIAWFTASDVINFEVENNADFVWQWTVLISPLLPKLFAIICPAATSAMPNIVLVT